MKVGTSTIEGKEIKKGKILMNNEKKILMNNKKLRDKNIKRTILRKLKRQLKI